MIKRWKELSELPCVKEYGIRHKIAHIIGTDNVSLCIAAYFAEGVRKGITEEDNQMSDICRNCNGHGYVWAHFSYAKCGECSGDGMVYAGDKEEADGK